VLRASASCAVTEQARGSNSVPRVKQFSEALADQLGFSVGFVAGTAQVEDNGGAAVVRSAITMD